MKGVSSLIWPYVQLARVDIFPAGMIHMFWPAAWGMTMASLKTGTAPLILIKLLIVAFSGAMVSHGAGCTINDILDIEIDRENEWTRHRPLPSGRVSLRAAWIFYAVQVSLCLFILSYTSTQVFWLGLIAIGLIHTMYPFMKRLTYWPQAWLGMALAWDLPIGWLAVDKNANWIHLIIFAVGIACWILMVDTIYALRDRSEDIRTGVKSTAVLFGDNAKAFLSLFAAIFVATLIFAGASNGQGAGFFVVGVGGTAAHLIWELATLDIDDKASCWEIFKASGNMGFIVWFGTLIDYALVILS